MFTDTLLRTSLPLSHAVCLSFGPSLPGGRLHRQMDGCKLYTKTMTSYWHYCKLEIVFSSGRYLRNRDQFNYYIIAILSLKRHIVWLWYRVKLNGLIVYIPVIPVSKTFGRWTLSLLVACNTGHLWDLFHCCWHSHRLRLVTQPHF